jgi:excisionase family DNA binding protein
MIDDYKDMTQQLYSVEQVANVLNLHVRTIRRYVRDGRLRAKRIGKEYRITRADLDEFSGASASAALDLPVPTTRYVVASTIVDIDAIGPDESHRITTMIMASLNSRRGEGDFPSVNSIYYPERGRLRITITANPALTASMLQLIDGLSKGSRGEHL